MSEKHASTALLLASALTVAMAGLEFRKGG